MGMSGMVRDGFGSLAIFSLVSLMMIFRNEFNDTANKENQHTNGNQHHNYNTTHDITRHTNHHNTSKRYMITTTNKIRTITLPVVGVKSIATERIKCSTLNKNINIDIQSNTNNINTYTVESQLTSPPVEAKKLQNCTVDVNIEPCSCTRRVTAQAVAPCPVGGKELLTHIKEEFSESTCSDLATLRGPWQQVVSFSIFGPFPSDYYLGIKLLIPRIREAYPGWNVRVYVDMNDSSPGLLPWICSLTCRYPHLDFCDINQLPTVEGVWQGGGQGWRLGVVGESLVSHYMVRDADSPLLIREVHAVHEWLNQGTCYHIMRDNPFHGVEMLAGLWGGCNTWQAAVGAEIGQYSLCMPIQDQAFLKTQVWPVARLNSTIHDSYTCRRFPGSQPFPSQRVNFTFVGQRTLRNRYRWERTHTICPTYCRPHNHQDWLYC